MRYKIVITVGDKSESTIINKMFVTPRLNTGIKPNTAGQAKMHTNTAASIAVKSTVVIAPNGLQRR